MKDSRLNDKLINLKKCLFKCSDLLIALGMSTLMILLLFFSTSLYNAFQKDFIGSNLLFVIIMLLLFYIIISFRERMKFGYNLDKIVKYLVIIFFIAQLFIFYNIFFETGWDVQSIRQIALAISENKSVDTSYLNAYPNNMFLTSLYVAIFKINNFFGVFSGEYSTFCLVVINCIISSLVSYLTYKILEKFFDRKYSFIGYLLVVGLVVFSPWNVIFYSDSLGLLFPVLIIYIFFSERVNIYCKYICIFSLGYIGFKIKPQCIIVVIAIVLCVFIRNLNFIKPNIIKKAFIILFASSTISCGIEKSITLFNENYGLVKNDEMELGLTHFLMMGLNYETKGVYSYEDVVYSMSFTSSKEREEANLQVASQRISSLGIKGIVQLMFDKAMINFNDGTFAWGAEGNFYKVMKNDVDKTVSPLLKSVYYTTSENFKYYSTFTQLIWINILFLIFYKAIKQLFVKNGEIDYKYQVLIIALLGLTIFELIFEARARYLYTYVPLFIVVSMYGFKELGFDLSEFKLFLINKYKK